METDDRRVLLVEDTLTQAMLYQHMLEKRGFKVKIARSGKQALEHIEKEKPAIILTDINMPDMDGYQLSRAVKDSDTTCDIIVVLLTTTLSPESIFDCINSGADEISLKGLREDAFLDLMEACALRKLEFESGGDTTASATVTQGEQSVQIQISEKQNLRLLLSMYDLLRRVQED